MKNCKRAICIILSLAILVSAVFINGIISFSEGNLWNGVVATSFSSGTGTSDDPYIIKTAGELAYLSQQVNNYYSEYTGVYFELGADIILNDTDNFESWGSLDNNGNVIAPANVWTPIGNYSYNGFNGHFDGKGYTVYGVYVDGNKGAYFGLFGYLGESAYYGYGTKQTVKNLKVKESYVFADNVSQNATTCVGGIVGYGNAENCEFDGKVCGVTDKYYYIGGVVGNGEAYNCSNYATVTGDFVGGVVCTGKASFCNNYGDIYAYDTAGGVIAEGSAKYCKNTGNIYAYGAGIVGGVVGNNHVYSATELIQYCFNSGDITVEGANYDTVGGVAGSGVVCDSYNSGNITLAQSEGENNVGGIVGNADANIEITLSGCYNSGNISVDCIGNIGAIIGNLETDEVTVENCYYLDSSCSLGGYGVALSDSQMKSAASFKNWNFNRVWEYLENNEYPYPTLRCFGSKKYYYSARFLLGDGTFTSEALAEENGEITFKEPTKQVGKEFCYWENDGKHYFAGDTFVMTKDEVFYAVFQRQNTSSSAWDGSIAETLKGSGTEDDPYLITSAKELAYFAKTVNEGEKYKGEYLSLTNDIYLNDAVEDYDYYTLAENQWTPIGNYSYGFEGVFNGNGHTVNGLYIRSSEQYMGLFGRTISGKVYDLNVENSAVICYFDNFDTIYAGLIAGSSSGNIENCTTDGSVQIITSRFDYDNDYKSLYLGGVAGYSSATVSGCVNKADVSFTSVSGTLGVMDSYMNLSGVVGGGTDIKDCDNYGTVSSYGVTTYYSYNTVKLSGIVGTAENVTDSNNYGNVSASKFFLSSFENDSISVSGICARLDKEIKNCYNFGDVSGYSSAAGIVSQVFSSVAVVDNCVNEGNVTGGTVGGIAADGAGIIRFCENKGELTLIADYKNGGCIGGIAANGNKAFRCVNRGKIITNAVYNDSSCIIGGIFGYINNGNNAGAINTVSECVSYADIIYESDKSSSHYVSVGGIVGGNNSQYTLVEKCAFKGNVVAENIGHVSIGGIVGKGSAENCLFEGNITVSISSLSDDVSVGGVVGKGTVKNSLSLGKVTHKQVENYSTNYYDFYVGAVSGDPDNQADNSFYLYTPDAEEEFINKTGTKGNSQTLSTKSTFNGWDFNKVWEMRSNIGSSYPTLRFLGSNTYMYYLQYVDGGKTLSKQLLSGGSSIDFSAPYEKSGYTFAYWEKDGIYYYPEDSKLLSEDGIYNAVWIYNNKETSWDGELVDTDWQGSGSEDDPYLITSAEELAGLAKKVNESSNNSYEGLFFKQTDDIYLNDAYGYSHYVMAQNLWTPIGKSSNYSFKGNYDGDGHTVYGIYIKSNANYEGKIQIGGLFGYVNNVTIKNLTVDNSYLEHFGKNDYSAVYGGFVGRVYYDSIIKLENCVNKANVHTDYHSGGFVGSVEDNLIISNCENYGEISGTTAGGFVGYVDNSMNETRISIRDSVNYGKVSDLEFIGSYTGGFIGYLYNYYTTMDGLSELVNLENKGEITCKHGNSGGIAGYVYYAYTVENCVNNGKINAVTGGGIIGGVNNYSSIKNSTNNVSVFATNSAGGIVAVSSNSNGSVYIGDCENNADIKSEKYAGGIVATGRSYVYDTVNNGSVTGNDYAGGISAESSGTVSGCENYGNIYSKSHVGGIAGGGTPYVENCANFGTVTSTDSYAGGIVGYWTWNSYATITNSYNSGNIKGVRNVGGILGYDNTQGKGNLSDCYNLGTVFGEEYVGGVAGRGTAVNCYNIGDVNGERNVGGVVGEGTARYSYNKGNVTGEGYYIGGISGYGGASNCYNTGTVTGESYVGGISGYGDSDCCYNIGNVYGKYYVGVISGYRNDTNTNCYYLDSIVISAETDDSIYYNGTAVNSETLSSPSLEGFDFEGTWEIGAIEDYSYPTLKNTTHTITYTVSFLDKDGTVLKQQQVRKGYNAYPPEIESFIEGDSVYALDHWEGSYKNITSDTSVKAVYKKTDIIKFKGVNHNLTVPFGFSEDNLTALLESTYSRILCTTTHNYKMNCEVKWDLNGYNPNASGNYTLKGTAEITDSPYYAFAQGESITLTVTVLNGAEGEFDISHLTYSENADGTLTITGYNGSAQDVIVPSAIGGKTVSAISENAFKDNESIITLYIPSTVKTVGSNAFAGCSNLIQITFSEGIETVGKYALGDTALTNVTLPKSLVTIGEKAFGSYENDKLVQDFTVYAFGGTAACTFANDNGFKLVTVESKTDSSTGITVIAEEGVELSVSKVVGGDYFDTANTIVEKANISLFEIKIFNNSETELQPGNMMTITVPVPAGFNNNSKVYRINADGSYLDMNARIVDGMLVFNTSHLSYYAIISEDDVLLGDANGDGKIDTTDLAVMKLHLAGLSGDIAEGIDMNADGIVNTTDLAELKLYLAEN